VKISLALPQADEIASTENFLNMARSAEKENVDSLWVFEQLLWPQSANTVPWTSDGHLPEEYQIIFDPLQTIDFAAANL